MYNGKIPFGKCPDDSMDYWIDNFTWQGTIEFLHFRRGRSAAHAIFEVVRSEDARVDVGDNHVMFLTYLSDVINKNMIRNGFVTGEFTFYKRGSNFSIGLA
jgi:hypothetical protein